MTEQISHKKSLRVSRLSTDRQLLLNKYKQENTEDDVSMKDISGNVSDTDNNNNNNGKNSTSTDVLNGNRQEDEEKRSSYTFKELIQIHNTLLGKEQETNNMIKSTIYDNYYDLIRVNDSLENILDPNSDINLMWDKLQQNINT